MKTFINIYQNRNDDFFFVKDKEGTHKLSIDWYFVMKAKDATAAKPQLLEMKEVKYITKFKREGDWVKIYCQYNRRESVVRYLHECNFQTYEADLPMWMRYLVDEDIELDIDQKILYFDIETDDTMPGIVPGADRITCIGAIGSDGKKYQFFSVTNEKKILKQFVNLIENYDILTGWNSETFDLVAIIKRCEIYGIKIGAWASTWDKAGKGGLTGVRTSGKDRARPQTFNHIDMMMKVKEMHYRDTELIKKVRSFSLEAVSQHFLNEGKLDRNKGYVSTYTLAREKPKFFKEYNMRDVELLVKLDKKLNIIQQKLIEHQVCNARLNDYTSHGKIDPFALRAARKLGEHLPSRNGFWADPNKESAEDLEIAGHTLGYHGNVPTAGTNFKTIDPGTMEELQRGTKAEPDYIGGFVFEPKKGKHKNVYIFDFQSLYPSIIKTFNVSLDTYLGVRETYKGKGIVMPIEDKTKRSVFKKDKKGIIPSIIQNVLDQRNNIRFGIMKKVEKDSPEYWNWHYRQYAFKVLANSMYGIMGANFSRYFKKELAEGITLTGQYLIKTMWKWMEDQGFEPIYGDSDSIFVKIHREVDIEKMCKAMKKFLDAKIVKLNVNESHLQMDFEKKFDNFLMVAKKKYMGRSANGDEKVSGLEFKKRDTLPKAEEWQKKLINSLLDTDKDADHYMNVFKKCKELVYSGKLKKEELTFQARLSQEPEDYGQKPIRDRKNGGYKLDKNGDPRMVNVPVHAKVALAMKEKLGNDRSSGKTSSFSAGSYIPYIVVDTSNKTEAVHADEFTGHYDKEYYWERCYGPSQRILEVVFPEVDWTMREKKVRKKIIQQELKLTIQRKRKIKTWENDTSESESVSTKAEEANFTASNNIAI